MWDLVVLYLPLDGVGALSVCTCGENSLLVINRLSREVSELRKDASIIEKDIQQDSIAAVSLYGNPDAIETYGRENYYMKRENEDIFIIKD